MGLPAIKLDTLNIAKDLENSGVLIIALKWAWAEKRLTFLSIWHD